MRKAVRFFMIKMEKNHGDRFNYKNHRSLHRPDQVKEGKLSWDDKVSISDYAENLSVTPDLSNVPLHKENTHTVKELFDSAIIQSANASMVALAEKSLAAKQNSLNE